MKLILKEYLANLKESKELDALLPDLLLAKNMIPICKAQVGVRQYGVDVSAADENNTLYLFTIKCGDLGRKDWDDGTPQSIRSSLNEIIDVYIPNLVGTKYEKYKKKIVLLTGGDMKQEIESNWNGHMKKHVSETLSFDFWGGDKLSKYIEDSLLNDYLFKDEYRSNIRKTLALIDDVDYNYSDFYKLVQDLFNIENFDGYKKNKKIREVCNNIRTINLILNIVYKWADNNNNLKPALICSEEVMLKVFSSCCSLNVISNIQVGEQINNLYKTLFRIYDEYFNKINSRYSVFNGIYGGAYDFTIQSISAFEQLGFLAIYNLLLEQELEIHFTEEVNEKYNKAQSALINILDNHPSLETPAYDEHFIEICLTCLALYKNNTSRISHYLNRIAGTVFYAFNTYGKYFPVSDDSFDSSIKLSINNNTDKKELFDVSTIIPLLQQWSCVLDDNDNFNFIKSCYSDEVFNDTNFQIWYPDSESELKSYISHMKAIRIGASELSIDINISMDELKKRISEVQKNTITYESLFAVKYSIPVLPLIASRHNRVPVYPIYWQKLLLDNSKSQAAE